MGDFQPYGDSKTRTKIEKKQKKKRESYVWEKIIGRGEHTEITNELMVPPLGQTQSTVRGDRRII